MPEQVHAYGPCMVYRYPVYAVFPLSGMPNARCAQPHLGMTIKRQARPVSFASSVYSCGTPGCTGSTTLFFARFLTMITAAMTAVSTRAPPMPTAKPMMSAFLSSLSPSLLGAVLGGGGGGGGETSSGSCVATDSSSTSRRISQCLIQQ